MNKKPELTSDLIVTKKGEAKQSGLFVASSSEKAHRQEPQEEIPYEMPKSITVKMNPKRYDILKEIGFKQKKTNQQIMTEAFDMWLSKQ